MSLAQACHLEKQIALRQPLKRVWYAISEAKQFGAWLGLEFDGEFAPGARLRATIAPTIFDVEVANLQEPYRGMTFDFTIDRVEPMCLFSFRWHPHPVDRNVDYSREPTTLIVFELHEMSGETMLSITESGFDRIPLGRRQTVYRANDDGWTRATTLIKNFLARTT